MLELKLPASKGASRHAATTAQGRSIKPERAVLSDGRGPERIVLRETRAPESIVLRDVRRSDAALHDTRAAVRSAAAVQPRYTGRAAAAPLAAPGREWTPGGFPASSATPRIRTATPARREDGRLRRARRASSFDDRLARSETRLVGAAVACTSLVCILLVVYLAAYANVTSLGIQQAQVAKALRGARQQNEILRAELAAARSPQHVVASAQMQGMVPADGRACYVTGPGAAPSTPIHSRYQVASDGTDTGDSTANFGH